MKLSQAKAYRAKIETAAAGLDDTTALDSIELFPVWAAGQQVIVGYRCRYKDKLYKVIQAHTTQANWTPDITPALWTEVSIEEWPEWKQPLGSEDAYHLGDKVSHNNKHWESIVDANVWEPGANGTESLWKEV